MNSVEISGDDSCLFLANSKIFPNINDNTGKKITRFHASGEQIHDDEYVNTHNEC